MSGLLIYRMLLQVGVPAQPPQDATNSLCPGDTQPTIEGQ